MRKRFSLVLVSLASLICLGCATIINPLTGRRESILSLYDTPSEVAIGKRIAEQIEKKEKVYTDNPEYNRRLAEVSGRIAAASDRQDLTYHFKILDKKEINAFAIFGGYIYIYRGLLDKIGSDDELAAVLAHEVGHVSGRHLAKRMQQVLGYQVVSAVALSAIYGSKQPDPNITRIMNYSYMIIQNGYSRRDETEADRLAVKYTRKAGFDPQGVVRLLQRIEEESKKQGGGDIFGNITIFRSHPQTEERVRVVREEIANPTQPQAQ